MHACPMPHCMQGSCEPYLHCMAAGACPLHERRLDVIELGMDALHLQGKGMHACRACGDHNVNAWTRHDPHSWHVHALPACQGMRAGGRKGMMAWRSRKQSEHVWTVHSPQQQPSALFAAHKSHGVLNPSSVTCNSLPGRQENCRVHQPQDTPA